MALLARRGLPGLEGLGGVDDSLAGILGSALGELADLLVSGRVCNYGDIYDVSACCNAFFLMRRVNKNLPYTAKVSLFEEVTQSPFT